MTYKNGIKEYSLTIENGDWSAVIDLAHGANCIELKNKRYGASLLREPPKNGELDNPYLYGMPLLFPVNRIENGTFEFEGRRYVFPINEPSTGCHLHGEFTPTFTAYPPELPTILPPVISNRPNVPVVMVSPPRLFLIQPPLIKTPSHI